MQQQFPLTLSRERRPTFDNFIADGNEEAVAAIRGLVATGRADSIYLSGDGCGKTHLLLAASNATDAAGKSAIYLSMKEIAATDPDLVKDLPPCDLLCIDDIDRIAGDARWEEALFRLYNQVRDAGGCLLIAGKRNLANLQLRLPDLLSRLGWGASYQIQTLGDEARKRLLLQIAVDKGMEMKADAADYLLKRYSRDIRALVELMELLDRRSLAAKQKLTIPFLRQSLSAINAGSS
jgi:DnaA family protein